ncbi:MAG: hypothetical protein OTI35_08990, partial [Sulfitobacter sp.]|nr:hypothetical protein [Sulfitobacter sp.]
MKSPGKPNLGHDDELEALICDCIDLLLPTLPPERAKVVRAINVERASIHSVAEELGLSLSEVTTCLTSGRQSLKERFREMSMICP